MALFLHADGRLLLPTARHIWGQVLSHETEVVGHIQGAEAHHAFARLRQAAETQGQSIYDELVLAHRDYCELSVGGPVPRGNREKAITMLLRIWVSVPRHLRPFRDEGLEYMERLPVDGRIAVHWGMAMAVYPFLGAVAAAVGRLVRLQGTCAAAHVQRRLRAHLGERATVARAVRRTLRCFVDWGTLLEIGERGVYQAAPARHV